MGFPHSGLEYAISSHHLNSIICDNVVAILKRSVCVARCLTNKTPNSVSWGLYPQCGKHVRLQLCTQIKVVVTQSTLVTEYFQSQGYSKCDFYPQWLGKGFFKWQFKLNCLPQGVHCFCRQIENNKKTHLPPRSSTSTSTSNRCAANNQKNLEPLYLHWLVGNDYADIWTKFICTTELRWVYYWEVLSEVHPTQSFNQPSIEACI